jgi:hypothetical protein
VLCAVAVGHLGMEHIKTVMVAMGYVDMDMAATTAMVDTSSLWLMHMQHWSPKSRVTGVSC